MAQRSESIQRETLPFWTPVCYPCSDDASEISKVHWLINKVDDFFHICGDIAIPTPRDDIRSLRGAASVVLSEGVYLMDDEGTWLGTTLKILAYITVVIPLIMLFLKVVLRCSHNYHIVPREQVFERRDLEAAGRRAALDRINAERQSEQDRRIAAQRAKEEKRQQGSGPGSGTGPSSASAALAPLPVVAATGARGSAEDRKLPELTKVGAGAGASSASSATPAALDPRIAQWASKYGFDQNKKFTSHLWLGGPDGVTVLESLTLSQAFAWTLNYIKGKTVVKLDHQTVEIEIFERRPHDQSKTSHRQLTPQEVVEMRQRTEMERTMTEILIYQNRFQHKAQDFTSDAFRQETRGADTLDMLEFVLRVLNRERVITNLKDGQMRGEWTFLVPRVST